MPSPIGTWIAPKSTRSISGTSGLGVPRAAVRHRTSARPSFSSSATVSSSVGSRSFSGSSSRRRRRNTTHAPSLLCSNGRRPRRSWTFPAYLRWIAETTVSAADPGRVSTSWKTARSTRWMTSCAMRSPRSRRTLVDVGVQQGDLDLSPVAGVDRARGVDDRHSQSSRQPGPRVHEGRVAVRQRERDDRSGTIARSPGASSTPWPANRSGPRHPDARTTAAGRPDPAADEYGDVLFHGAQPYRRWVTSPG